MIFGRASNSLRTVGFTVRGGSPEGCCNRRPHAEGHLRAEEAFRAGMLREPPMLLEGAVVIRC